MRWPLRRPRRGPPVGAGELGAPVGVGREEAEGEAEEEGEAAPRREETTGSFSSSLPRLPRSGTLGRSEEAGVGAAMAERARAATAVKNAGFIVEENVKNV